MGDEASDSMNLDLNLSPGPEPASISLLNEPVSLDPWSERSTVHRFSETESPIHRIREAVRIGARQRSRWRRVHTEARNISMELNHLMANSGSANTLQAGEGSVDAEERTNELLKTCENNNGILDEQASENKDEVEKGSGTDGSFFDCNICLDLARNPVVTCCGHLFCWPCLYRWLHVHSDAKECPVCKGEVTLRNVIPIYGRGNQVREPEEDSSLKIPARPQARRVESLRQTLHRTAFSFPVEEMIRRLGSRFEFSRDMIQTHESDSVRESAERTNTLLTRILSSRALRREQNQAAPTNEVMDLNLNQSTTITPETGDSRRLQSLLLRRSQSQRSAYSSLSSALLLEAYRSHPSGRNQELPPPVDDGDSFSSIAARINSESPADTAMEIDSIVSLSTSSSRRNDASRVSDVDSGDSRAHRRRRLN
ncbi:hypothetical protein UlMin_005133 [Ulmus minor]